MYSLYFMDLPMRSLKSIQFEFNLQFTGQGVLLTVEDRNVDPLSFLRWNVRPDLVCHHKRRFSSTSSTLILFSTVQQQRGEEMISHN